MCVSVSLRVCLCDQKGVASKGNIEVIVLDANVMWLLYRRGHRAGGAI